MEIVLYLEVNFMCIFILALVLVKLSVGGRVLKNQRFGYALINAIILCALDCLWKQINGVSSSSSIVLNRVVNAFYLFQAGHLGYSWYLFSDCLLYHQTKRQKLQRYLLSAIPVFILLILCITSIWNGAIFYVDDYNMYRRGPFYNVQPIISYSYVFYSAIKALIFGIREKNHVRKIECMTVASFIIMPILMGGIQFFFTEIPALSVGVTLSFLIVFITLQDYQISLDPLTELNNRHHLHKYLMSHSHLRGGGHKNHLYVMMIDVDSFKSINDTFGHVEGDQALKTVAEALRRACGIHNCFIARYGGDEFVVVYECPLEQNVIDMKNGIIEKLDALNRERNRGYSLSVSIGYSMYDATTENILELVAKADDQLYIIKQQRKNK